MEDLFSLELIQDPIDKAIEIIAAEEDRSRMENLHSSGIKKYYTCPHKFTLSRKYRVEKSSDALTYGLLLEGYLFGFKDKPGYSEFEIRGLGYNKDGVTLSKGKGKQDKTVQPIKERAQFLKKFFDLENGEAFVPLEFDGGFKNGMLKGEADWIGNGFVNMHILPDRNDNEETIKIHDFLPPVVQRRAIYDLKDTADLYYNWNIKYQMQVPQSIFYPYMWYKHTGEILDFCYVISWNKAQTIVKQLYFKTTEETFRLAEKLINEIETDLFKKPDVDVPNCIGRAFQGGCEYIEWCMEGRDLVAQSELMDLRYLESPRLRWQQEQLRSIVDEAQGDPTEDERDDYDINDDWSDPRDMGDQ